MTFKQFLKMMMSAVFYFSNRYIDGWIDIYI